MLTGYALNAGEARILVRMRILILGGTAWVGGSIARAAIARGHEVTCLARGSGVPDGAASVRADRDSAEAFAGVTSPGTPSWDAVIDVSSKPGQVRRAAEAFADRARQYVYISSCNAYASLSETGIEETAPLNEALDADEMGSASEYGAAKVACELAVLQRFGPDRTTIIRPGLIGGPGDPSGRTNYWPMRFATPSNADKRVLVPETGAPTSVIDVRDLADWTARLIQQFTTGVFNASGAVMPFSEYLAVAKATAGYHQETLAVSNAMLTEHGVSQWAGPRSLPLWVCDTDVAGIGALSNAKALDAGLELRPPTETMRETLAWCRGRGSAVVLGAGLTDAEERELLAALG